MHTLWCPDKKIQIRKTTNADYNTFCINTNCENYGCIADYAPENACQCNDACELYNDCCSGSYLYNFKFILNRFVKSI